MMDAQHIIQDLQAAGERITLPRRAVLDALLSLGGHQTTGSIQAHLAAQGVELAEPTIYRVLQWLKDCAVVAQTDLGQSGITYEILSEPPHHHLVCLGCGHLIDIDDDYLQALRERLQADFGFQPRIEHMAFFGVCAACKSVP
ncbi:MAG: Fur family transcriptional regulator [Anaerolineales bacterium]